MNAAKNFAADGIGFGLEVFGQDEERRICSRSRDSVSEFPKICARIVFSRSRATDNQADAARRCRIWTAPSSRGFVGLQRKPYSRRLEKKAAHNHMPVSLPNARLPVTRPSEALIVTEPIRLEWLNPEANRLASLRMFRWRFNRGFACVSSGD